MRSKRRAHQQATLVKRGAPGCREPHLFNAAGRADDDWLPAAPLNLSQFLAPGKLNRELIISDPVLHRIRD
jgi:hypothetical protein